MLTGRGRDASSERAGKEPITRNGTGQFLSPPLTSTSHHRSAAEPLRSRRKYRR